MGPGQVHWPFDKRIAQIYCLFGCFSFMCVLVLCVGQGEEGDFNHNMEIHNFISSAAAGHWWSRFGRGRGPGGVLELLFWRDERLEVRLEPLPISKDFSPSKNGISILPQHSVFHHPWKAQIARGGRENCLFFWHLLTYLFNQISVLDIPSTILKLRVSSFSWYLIQIFI